MELIYGSDAPMQAWQWVYLLNLMLATGMLIFGLTISGRRSSLVELIENSPGWISIPVSLVSIAGMFYATPPGLFFGFMMHAGMMSMGAPISALAISAIFTIGSWLLMILLFDQRFRGSRS